MIELKLLVDGKSITLLCDEGTTTHMAKYALCEFIKHVCQIDDNEKARLEADAAMQKESVDLKQEEEQPKAE